MKDVFVFAWTQNVSILQLIKHNKDSLVNSCNSQYQDKIDDKIMQIILHVHLYVCSARHCDLRLKACSLGAYTIWGHLHCKEIRFDKVSGRN